MILWWSQVPLKPPALDAIIQELPNTKICTSATNQVFDLRCELEYTVKNDGDCPRGPTCIVPRIQWSRMENSENPHKNGKTIEECIVIHILSMTSGWVYVDIDIYYNIWIWILEYWVYIRVTPVCKTYNWQGSLGIYVRCSWFLPCYYSGNLKIHHFFGAYLWLWEIWATPISVLVPLLVNLDLFCLLMYQEKNDHEENIFTISHAKLSHLLWLRRRSWSSESASGVGKLSFGMSNFRRFLVVQGNVVPSGNG